MLRRLNMERLDLVVPHWWDYAQPRWSWRRPRALRAAPRRQDQQGWAAPTDTDHMLDIVKAGVLLASMWQQYLLLDRRPEKRATKSASENGVALFCYGTVAGGFLGDKWLGAAELDDAPLENRLLVTNSSSTTRRLGLFPGLAAHVARHCRPPRHRNRHHRQRRDADAPGGRRGDRRAQPLASAQLAVADVALTSADEAEIAAALAEPGRLTQTSTRRARPPRHGRS